VKTTRTVAYEVLRERFGELYEAVIVAGEIPPKPFARELLMRLDALRIPCAVATSTRRVRAEAKLHRGHLMQHFKALACGDEVLRGKPHPEIYELAASRLGVQASRCLALEDSNAGVRSAASANMQVVMVPDLLRPDAGIRMLGVPVVESLKDVLVAIG
jgi:HAD superfamily hydrolase (TIGR01509 family)